MTQPPHPLPPSHEAVSAPVVFRCSGTLVPEDGHLALELPDLQHFDENGAVYCTSTTVIENSEMHVIIEGLSVPVGFDIRAFRTLTVQLAQLIADTILSAVCYEEGWNFSVRISRICDNTFNVNACELSPRSSFGPDPRSLRIDNHVGISKAIVSMSFRNEAFRKAVVDYSTALKWSLDAPFHCYRALEALCQHFGGKWDEMHNSLGTNRCTIYTLIKQHADPVRHGIDPDYPKVHDSVWYALTYVRDTLLAFLIINNTTSTDLGKCPVLDHNRIPGHIATKHKNGCTLGLNPRPNLCREHAA